MDIQFKTSLIGVLGSGITFGVAAADQVLVIDSTLKMLSCVLGIAVACYTLYWLRRSNMEDELRRRLMTVAQWQTICEKCQQGYPPKTCPLPITEKPSFCPMTHEKPTA